MSLGIGNRHLATQTHWRHSLHEGQGSLATAAHTHRRWSWWCWTARPPWQWRHHRSAQTPYAWRSFWPSWSCARWLCIGLVRLRQPWQRMGTFFYTRTISSQYHRTRSRPEFECEHRWLNRRNYSRMFSEHDRVGGGSMGFKFGRVTERAGARAFPSEATRESRVSSPHQRRWPDTSGVRIPRMDTYTLVPATYDVGRLKHMDIANSSLIAWREFK